MAGGSVIVEWARRRWLAPVAVFTLALALRLAWVLGVDRAGFAFNDSLIYHTTGISLSKGDGYAPLTGGPTARWPPGYSTLLGGIYWVFGTDPIWGELANALIGAATVVLLMVVVERAIDRPTAIVAGVLLAVFPGPIMWTDFLTSETVYTALFVVMMLVAISATPTWRWVLVIGVVVGVSALVRGEALTWILLPIVQWRRQIPFRRLAKLTAATVAVAAVVLAPWTIRNAVVMDAFVPLATNASQTLWSGHNPGATGGQTYPPDGYEDRFSPELPEHELEVSKALRNDAIEYMVTHPLRELELIPLKLIHLNRGDSFAFDWINDAGQTRPAPLSFHAEERVGVIADAVYYMVLGLTLLGVFVLGRQFWRSPIGLVVATSLLTALFLYGFLYYGNYRYRLPYAPMMVVVAATLLTRVWTNRRALANRV